jgi:hypothetical protein
MVSMLDELAASQHHRLQLTRLGVERCSHLDGDLLTEQGQDSSVDGVRFGQLAHAPRKVAHLARIHDGDTQAPIPQDTSHDALVAARCLEHDQSRLDLAQLL